ncbi:hypothetical protein ACQJBY_029586 [Aegilops geniculata]
MHDIDLTSDHLMHDFAHCDGLVLLPVGFTAYVLNPATRRTLKLPRGRGAEPPPRQKPLSFEMCHQAFGLGQDPRSGAYKVARFSYYSLHLITGMCSYRSITMEVFTIGTDRHWRETVTRPPYPVLARRAATFFKGSLIWAIDERNLGKAAPGFLRFSLEDEAFGVMPPPPCYPMLEYTRFSLSELRGELCLACKGANINSVELWMCNNVENPRWDRRYTIAVLMFRPPELCPIATFDDEIVFKERVSYMRRYNLKTKAYKDRFCMENLRYHHPSTGKLGFQRSIFFSFDVIPYVPSLIPV